MLLKCICGNETDFREETVVHFSVNSEREREEKLLEDTHFYCNDCDAEVYTGD